MADWTKLESYEPIDAVELHRREAQWTNAEIAAWLAEGERPFTINLLPKFVARLRKTSDR